MQFSEMKLRHPIPQTTSKQVLSHTPGRGFNYPNLSTPWVAESPSVQKWLQPHCIPCKGALCGIAWHCVGAPWTPSIHSQMLKISGGIPSSYTWNFGWYRDSFNWSSFFFHQTKKGPGHFLWQRYCVFMSKGTTMCFHTKSTPWQV